VWIVKAPQSCAGLRKIGKALWASRDFQPVSFLCHNNVDIAHGTDCLIRAPFARTVVRVDNQPTGGGIFVGIISDEIFTLR
jgi:hypothetical protein